MRIFGVIEDVRRRSSSGGRAFRRLALFSWTSDPLEKFIAVVSKLDSMQAMGSGSGDPGNAAERFSAV